MRVVRRDPDKGYLDTMLWVPKKYIPVDATKAALTFSTMTDRVQRFLTLWRETDHHLIIPREFWDLTTQNFPVVDCRPKNYPVTRVKSRIKLDLKSNFRETVQRDAVKAMQEARGGILQLACGTGKSQPITTPVLTPLGWVPIGTLRPGDFVFGSNGLPTEVLGVFPQGRLPVFRVTMEDGSSTRCSDEHLWFTQTPSDRRKNLPGQVRTLKTIRATLRTRSGLRHAIPRTSAIHFVTQGDLYEPWLIGFYLGNGTSSLYNGQRCVQFRKNDPQMHERVQEALARHGDISTRSEDKRSKNLTTSVLFSVNQPSHIWDVLTRFRLVGVPSEEKFIPLPYLRGSVEERWSLLEGLLDSSGSVTADARTFSTSSSRLRDDVTELARSLGARVTIEERQAHYTYLGESWNGAPTWRLYLSHDRWGHGRYNKQYIQSVEPDGEEECVCIKVAAEDELYVTENFIVTHNTICALELIAREQVPALIIVDNTHLVEQWMKEIHLHLEVPGGVGLIKAGKFDWQKEVVVATYHTLANLADEMPEEVRRWFGLIIWDEAHHMAAPTWMKAADLFPCKRIGLTATPERIDGMHVVYDFHLGPVIYKDLTQDLKPEIYFKWTGLEVDLSDPKVKAQVCDVNGELHTSMLASYFGQWRKRLDFILEEVRKAANEGRKILVLSYSIAELVNLYTLWNNGQSLYTDIPEPTPQDVGETLSPQYLDERTIRRLHKKLGELNCLLANSSLPFEQRRGVEVHKKDILNRLKQHEVWKKIENERDKRQRAYLKNALATYGSGTAGLMIGEIKAKERARMLAEKQVTFAIMKYGREGLDEQSLDTVFVCEPMSQKNVLQQIMGRVLRIKQGKKQPVVMFFEDNIGPMMGMCQNLRRHLSSWPIEEGGPFEYKLIGHPRKGIGRPTWGMTV